MRFYRIPLVFVFSCLSGVPAIAADTLRIELRGGKSTRLEIIGLTGEQSRRLKALSDEQWVKVFPVRVAAGSRTESEKLPAILGRWSVETNRALFVPRFAFEPGLAYRAVFNPRLAFGPKAGRPLELRFTLPKPKPPRLPVVTQVYPSGSVLPENLLKFYIHFSVPMSRGEAYRRITLHDATGKLVPKPFLELEQELWDRSGTRFTLFFEPGRIKRGLRPRAELGPALREGKSYTLRIDPAWPTASGHRLTKAFEKKFRVGPPDAGQPTPKRWKVAAPAAATRTPFVLRFDKPLDRAMLDWAIRVRTSSGKTVDGTVAVDEHEQRWRFTPNANWSAGGYVLQIDTRLEDRSGNSVGRPFESPETGSRKPPKLPPTVELKFQVAG